MSATLEVPKLSKKAEKRVQIAKDVIEQLEAPDPIFEVRDDFDYVVVQPKRGKSIVGDEDTELKEAFEKRVKSCETCALGAMFVCTLLRYNSLTVKKANFERSIPAELTRMVTSSVEERIEGRDVDKYLTKYFEPKQTELIEYAFEPKGEYRAIQGPYKTFDTNSLEAKVADLYVSAYDDPKDRLKAIMQNIIDNHGEFVCDIRMLSL